MLAYSNFYTYEMHNRNLRVELCSLFFGLPIVYRIFIKYFDGFTEMQFLLFSQPKNQF